MLPLLRECVCGMCKSILILLVQRAGHGAEMGG